MQRSRTKREGAHAAETPARHDVFAAWTHGFIMEKALLEPDDFPTSPLIKDVQRPIFSATMYIRKTIIVINVPPLSSGQCLSYPALPVQESLRHDTVGGRYASKICDGQVRLSIGIEDADDLIAVWSRHWHRSDRLRRIVEEAFVLLRFCL